MYHFILHTVIFVFNSLKIYGWCNGWAREKLLRGLVLQVSGAKEFSRQHLSYWLKKIKKEDHEYYESTNIAKKFQSQWGAW